MQRLQRGAGIGVPVQQHLPGHHLYLLGWGCSVQLCPDFQKAVLVLTSAGLAMLLLPCHGQWDDFPCRLETFPGLPWFFPLREELRDASALELLEFSAGTCHSWSILS